MTRVAVLPRASHSSTFVLEAEDFRSRLPNDEFIALERHEDIGKIARCEVAVGFCDPSRARLIVDAAPGLRWWSSLSAGVQDLIDAGVVGHPGLIVTNNRGTYDTPVAEHAMAMIGSAAKQLFRYEAARAARRWELLPGSTELHGATLVVFGIGSIGRQIARLGACAGMRVLAVRRHPDRPAPEAERIYGLQTFREAAAQADYLVLSAPLTKETHGAVSADILTCMKPTAWLINVARGKLVDEHALIRALAERRIGGAAIDSFVVEPLPPDHPLWTFENVILTPHVSTSSPRLAERSLNGFAANLAKFKAGAPLHNVIDPALGY